MTGKAELKSSNLIRLNINQCMTLLKNAKAEVRINGCVALAKTGHREARRILTMMAMRDESDKVRKAARRLLSLAREEEKERPAAELELTEKLNSQAPRLRLLAAQEIAQKKEKQYLRPVLDCLRSEGSPQVKIALIKAVGALGGKGELRCLASYSRDYDPLVRLSALEALMETREKSAFALVFRCYADENELVRQKAHEALSILGVERSLKLLEHMSKSDQAWLRETAAAMLGFIDLDKSLQLLENLFDDPVLAVRKVVEGSLGELAQRGNEEAGRILELLANQTSTEQSLSLSRAQLDPVEASIRAITTDLASDNAFIRLKAVNAVIKRNNRDELDVLVDHLIHETNNYVVSRVMTAIGLLGDSQKSSNRSILEEHLRDNDLRIVANAIEAATALNCKSLRPQIRPFVVSENSRLRANALLYLTDCPTIDIAKELSTMSLHMDEAMQLSAIYAVEQMVHEKPGLVTQLTPIAQSHNGRVHFALVEALERMAKSGNEHAVRLLRTTRGEGLGLSTVMPALRVEKASYLKRIVAFSVDGFVIFWLFWILFIFITCCTAVVAVVDKEVFGKLFQSNTALLALAYITLLFTRDGFFGGRGFGKRWLGLRIIDIHTGKGCGFFRSLLRQATFGLPVINIVEAIMPAVDERGQRLIDKLLGTEVIDEKRKPMTPLQWLVALPGVFFVGTTVLLLVIGLFLTIIQSIAGGR